MTAAALDQTALDKVPPVAGTVMTLLRSLDDENLDASHLAKQIGQDPVLTARVLKIVNSPFYGVAGRIASLQEAVMVLGFSSVRRLALAVSLNGSFPMHGTGEADPRRLWRHSFCTALCAQALARLARLARVDPETAFTAGLLHDIGRIALAAVVPDHFAAVLAARRHHPDLTATEQAVLGFSHAEFGARLLERWHLPRPLLRAVEYHHCPDTAPTDSLTDLVSLADQLAHAVSENVLDAVINGSAPNGAAIRLGIARVQCLEALAPVPERLEAFAAALH